MSRIFILLLLGWLSTGPRPAATQPTQEEEQFRVQTFTTIHGLPSNTIYKVLVDRLGYIWIGTHNGLVRYDGYTFETYREAGPVGVTPISALYEDPEGHIWAGGTPLVPGGVSRLDRDTGEVTLFRADPNDPNGLVHNGVSSFFASADEPNRLWVVAHSPFISNLGGIGYFDTATLRFTPWAPPDSAAERGASMAGMIDSQGELWLGGAGLSRFDSLSNAYETWRPDPDSSFWPHRGDRIEDNYFTTIYEAPSEPGVLWLGGLRGLHRFSKQTRTFTSYFPFPEDKENERNRIYAILEDRDGLLWVGTQDGLFTFDRQDERFESYEDLSSLEIIYSIEEDLFGTIWTGTNNGLLKVEHRINPFRAYFHDPGNANSIGDGRAGALLLDGAGDLWISTSGEGGQINVLNRATGTVDRYPAPGVFNHFYKDASGVIWTGNCNSGLLHFDTGRPDRYGRYPQVPEDSLSLNLGCVNPLLEDSRKNFWVPIWAGGLDRLDRESGTFTHFRNDPQDPESIGSDYALRVYEDRAGVIWVGTEAGISRLDATTGAFKNYHPELLRRSMMMHEDRKGRFWVATANAGLHLFDRESGAIRKSITTANGLLSNIVWSILEDEAGNLWLSCDRSLAKYNPDNDVVTTYTTREGLPDILYHEASFFQNEDGELFFGGANGVVSFYPDRIEDNPLPPQVVLTRLLIDETPVTAGPDSPLSSSLARTSDLTLTYDQNDLAIEYVGLHSIDPANNRYRYKLEGYDEDWIEAGTQRIARYPRLPSADYTFRVIAASSDGVWNEAGASMRIRVLPPWWRSMYAYFLYILLMAGGIGAIVRSQRRRVLRRAMEESRERALIHAQELQKAHAELKKAHEHLRKTQNQLVQQEKMASLGQLTAGIAHEIRNPLNFVNNFARLNIELLEELMLDPEMRLADIKDAIEDLQLNAEKIHEHGARADRIVQSMMRHASGAPGQRKPIEINTFVDEYVNLALHGRTESLIKRSEDRSSFSAMPAINRHYDDAAGVITIVPQEIGQVLINLFNNAFDAMHEKKAKVVSDNYQPALAVSTFRKGEWVEIHVRDNGPGIPRQAQNRVFEPFFTTKPSGKGTGLGLSLCYDIVTHGHSGMLMLESEIGQGATFIIRLPA